MVMNLKFHVSKDPQNEGQSSLRMFLFSFICVCLLGCMTLSLLLFLKIVNRKLDRRSKHFQNIYSILRIGYVYIHFPAACKCSVRSALWIFGNQFINLYMAPVHKSEWKRENSGVWRFWGNGGANWLALTWQYFYHQYCWFKGKRLIDFHLWKISLLIGWLAFFTHVQLLIFSS